MWTPDVCGVDVRCLDFALEPFGGGLVLTGERLGRAGMGVACVLALGLSLGPARFWGASRCSESVAGVFRD